MKTKRLCSSALALLLFICMMGTCVHGTDSFLDNADYILQFSCQERTGELLIAGNELEGDASPEQFQVMLGTTEMTVESVQSTEAEPVTFYCLADVSDSMTKQQIKLERKVLKGLRDALRVGDQMLIARLGDDVEESTYLTRREEITSAIEGIEVSATNTNLYAGITQALRSLSGSTQARRHKCLIVLSDGEDYKKDGSTRTEMEREIARSHIPVCTVALMNQNTVSSKKWQKYAKQLSSFARLSPGGTASNPVLNGEEDGKKVGAELAAQRRKDVCLRFTAPDDSEPIRDSGATALTVRFQSERGNTLDDVITVYPQDLVSLWEEQAGGEQAHMQDQKHPEQESDASVSAASSGSSAASSGTVQEEPSVWEKNWKWILAAVLLLLVVLVAVLLWRRRSRAKEKKSEKSSFRRTTIKIDDARTNVSGAIPVRKPERDDKPPKDPEPPAPVRNMGREVCFNLIGDNQWSKSVRLLRDVEYSFGRDNNADVILNAEDAALSRPHFYLVCRKNGVYLWDADSRNSTFVDGARLKPWQPIRLQSDTKVKAGRYEYRIRFSQERVL